MSYTTPYVTCAFCKETKRKCNGQKPACSNCLQYKQVCDYNLLKPATSHSNNHNEQHQTNSDRRRRKYHTDYIDSLEKDSVRLTNFIKNFAQDEPLLQGTLNEKLENISKFEEEQNAQIQASISDFDDLNDLLEATENLNLEDNNSKTVYIDPFASEFQETILNTANLTGISQNSTPLSISTNQSLQITEPNYQLYILRLFKQYSAIHSPPLIKLTTYFESINYNDPIPITQKLLFNVILGVGNIYSSHKDKSSHELYFISLAKDMVMDVVCKSKVDIYSILSIYLLSVYEFSQNRISQSYVFDSIACSLTQHMGLHISYEDSRHAPKQPPFNLAILWSVCSQDRLVTGVLKVPCVLHFKRIISPFYQVVTDPSNAYHVAELFFSCNVRLSYIFDRFTDQIFTTNFDIGDTNNKGKLLSMGLRTLEELKESLPIKLRLSSLNDSKDDFYILLFQFNYQVTLIFFNKLFIREITNLSLIKKSIVNSTLEAGKLLVMLDNEEFIPRLPYYVPNYIHTVGLVLLFLLTIEQKNEEFDKLSFHFQTVKILLKKTSTYWKSSSDYLNNLEELLIKHGLASQSIPELLPTFTEPAFRPEPEVSESNNGANMDYLFSKWGQQFPEFSELKDQYDEKMFDHLLNQSSLDEESGFK